MADIFISYSHADREAVERIVAALEAQGFTVWIDRHLTPGERFSHQLAQELDAAKAVIVAWSASAVNSAWVADEATVGRDTGRLVPVSLDGSAPPLGFRQYQTVDLSKWVGDAAHAPFQTFASALGAVVRGERIAAPAPAPGHGFSHAAAPAAARAPIPGLALIAGAAAAVLAAGGAIYHFASGRGSAPSGTEAVAEAPSVAVIPFANISADSAHGLFVDGLSDELISGLSSIEGLRVPGRNSSFYFKDRPAPVTEVAQQLNVRYVLEGSVRRDGDNLRISTQLTDASTGFQVWSQTYDRKLADIFAVQRDIAQQVVSVLPGLIGITIAAAADDVDPRAHEHFLVGLGHMRARYAGSGWNEAHESFRKAVDLAPSYALANAYLAVTTVVLGEPDAPEKAADALAVAVAAAPDNPDVLFAQGFYAENFGADGAPDPQAGRRFFDRAIAIDPSHSEALHARIRSEKDPERVLQLYRELLAADPLFINARVNYAGNLAKFGRWDEAEREYEKIIDLRPDLGREGMIEVARSRGSPDRAAHVAFRDFGPESLERAEIYFVAGLLADLGADEEAAFLYTASAPAEFLFLPGQHDVFKAWSRQDPAGARDVIAAIDFPLRAPNSVFGAIVATLAGDSTLVLNLLDAFDPGIAFWSEEKIRSSGLMPGQFAVRCYAIALHRTGRGAEAARLFKALLAATDTLAERGEAQRYHIFRAADFAHFGDRRSAIDELRKARAAGWRYPRTYAVPFSPWPAVDSPHGLLAPLRDDPEFQALMAEIRAENAEALERYERDYGILTRVRALMAASAESGAPGN